MKVEKKVIMVTLTLTPEEALMLKALVGGISGDRIENYGFGSLRRNAGLFPDNDLREKLTTPLYGALSDVVC